MGEQRIALINTGIAATTHLTSAADR